jgi:hypothetical protein
VTDELAVHISRTELHSLEVPPSFEVTGSFDVRLVNHGKSVHVHLHLDDALSRVARLDAGNHYVEGNSERMIHVEVDEDTIDAIDEDTLLGKLKVAVGYGATTRWIDIEVSPPDDGNDGVRVDESLTTPQHEPEPEPLISNPALPVLAIGAIALLVAALTALLINDTTILLGSIIVLGGVLVALFFLIQDYGL